jgi:predicted dehydrogenase
MMASTAPPVRFGVIGLNHPHIFEMTQILLGAGGQLVSYFAEEDDLAEAFAAHFDRPPRARSLEVLLENPAIELVACAAIFSERGPIGIQAMRHGKDVLSDKPAFTSLDVLEEARAVQRETGRIYNVDFGERLRSRAMVRASELIAAGAIGRVLQTVGLGPHRLAQHVRPAWFFEKARYGGILTDIGSHQADHFLHFTGSSTFEVVAAQVGNLGHPDQPEFEDFGDALVRGGGRGRGTDGDLASGYFRVDWFSPAGLNGNDGRMTILGTDGFIEVRKNLDLAGRPGRAHLFLSDQQSTQYVDCSTVEMPFGRQLLEDVRNRTETAMPQAHAFLAAELALRCELAATRIGSSPVAVTRRESDVAPLR